MKHYRVLALAIIGVLAAIIIPLALISGAVNATKGHTEYQITSTPEAILTVPSTTKDQATVEFTVNRSDMIINEYITNDAAGVTKYEYIENYRIYFIDIDEFNKQVEEYKQRYKRENDGREVSDSIAKSAVDMKPYIFEDKILEVMGSNVYINKDISSMYKNIIDVDDEEEEEGSESQQPTIIEPDDTVTITRDTTYLLTGDTYAKEGKKYFKQKGKDFEEVEVKLGATLEKGVYYEEIVSSHFEFTFGGLESDHYYAVAIKFSYSPDGVSSGRYNDILSDYKDFKTK